MSLPTQQYAFLSRRIYEPLSVGSTVRSNTREFFVHYVSPPSTTNYRGAVVQDLATGQLVVVNKGTDPTSIHDLSADLGMGMMGAPTQWPEAAQTLREALHVASRQHVPKDNISITGHSLGGALAQLQTTLPEASGIYAETFNAYGARSMAESLRRVQPLDVDTAMDRVVNHRMYHDPVSQIAEYIGRTENYMDIGDYQRHKEGNFFPAGETGAIAASHAIGNFWDKERNQPGAVFAHNYMRDLEHRPLDDLPRGVPMDLSAPWNSIGHNERAPSSPAWMATDTRPPADAPALNHLDADKQALYSALQERVPEAGPKRLMQFTAACHENGINARNFDRVHLNEDAMTIGFHGKSLLATPAVVDLTQRAPEPGHSMQQICNVDRQQMEMAQQIAQSAQLSQQGPVR